MIFFFGEEAFDGVLQELDLCMFQRIVNTSCHTSCKLMCACKPFIHFDVMFNIHLKFNYVLQYMSGLYCISTCCLNSDTLTLFLRNCVRESIRLT